MSDADHCDDDLGALFERVTGESTITERQQESPSHLALDRTR
jgi:hypothetical protein